MEEIEDPTESIREEMHEHAHHESRGWVMWVAFSSAVLAGLAAVSGLMSGHHSNEAMIAQIEASNAWSYYQAKGIKASVLTSRVEMLGQLQKNYKDESASAKLEQYKQDQENISEKAEKLEAVSKHELQIHEIFARAVTLFQVAIALGAIAALSRKRRFWIVSLCFGGIGLGFLIQALISSGVSSL